MGLLRRHFVEVIATPQERQSQTPTRLRFRHYGECRLISLTLVSKKKKGCQPARQGDRGFNHESFRIKLGPGGTIGTKRAFFFFETLVREIDAQRTQRSG